MMSVSIEPTLQDKDQAVEMAQSFKREAAVARGLFCVLQTSAQRVEEGLGENMLRIFVGGRWYNIEVSEY
jgi:hypothetical protein